MVVWDNRGIAPRRTGAHTPPGYIRDDTIEDWLKLLTTDNVVISFDSCHSGTATRGALVARGLGTTPDASRGAPQSTAPAFLGDDERPDGPIFLAAARSSERALEGDVPSCEAELAAECRMGRSSCHLVRELRAIAAMPLAEAALLNYNDLIERIRGPMLAATEDQHPSLSGPGTKQLFAGAFVQRRPKPFTVSRSGRRLTILDAGALNGVEKDTVFAIYGQLPITEDASPIAHVKTVALRHDRAFAVAFDVKTGQRLKEIPPSIPETSWAQWDPAFKSVNALKVALVEAESVVRGHFDAIRTPFVQLVDSPASADVSLRRCSADKASHIACEALCPQSNECLVLARKGLDLLGIPKAKGKPQTDPLSPTDPLLAERVRVALELEYRRGLFMGLQAPVAMSDVKPALTVRRMKKVEDPRDGSWSTQGFAQKMRRGGPVDLDLCEPERGACEAWDLLVTNSGDVDLHISVIAFEVDGSITVAFPGEGELDDAIVKAGATRALSERVVTEPAGLTPYLVMAIEQRRVGAMPKKTFARVAFSVGTDGLVSARGARGSTERDVDGGPIPADPLERALGAFAADTGARGTFSLGKGRAAAGRWSVQRFEVNARVPQ